VCATECASSDESALDLAATAGILAAWHHRLVV
jgi:hypothetical protein